jgi:hypothetical protein
MEKWFISGVYFQLPCKKITIIIIIIIIIIIEITSLWSISSLTTIEANKYV